MHYSLARATTWNIAGYIYLIIASLISTPVLVHSLGIEQFAQYGLIIATLGLVSSLNLGLPQAVTRALSRDHEFSRGRQTLWATSSLLFVLTGLIGAEIAVIIGTFLRIPSLNLVLMFGIALMGNLLGHYSTLPHAEGHFGYFNVKTFIVGTANTFLAAYIAWAGHGTAGILIGQLLFSFIALLPLVYFSLKFFPRPRDGRVSKSVAGSLISFGLKNQVGTVIGQIQGQYAKYLLAAISPISLSAYVIAQGLVQKLAGGISQVSTALYPASARSKEPAIHALYHRLQLGLFTLGILGIGIYYLIGFPFLTWWLHSPELVGVVDSVLRILVIYFAVLILCPLSSTILDSRGRPELTSLFAFLTTAIEIISALLLFPRYGLFAPAYAALIAIILTTPALLFTTERVLKSSL